MPRKYLTDNDWALLRTISRRVVFKPREIIISNNPRPDALFILANGSAVVEVLCGTPIAKLAAGDICGEMAFIESNAASASVVAETETQVDVLDYPNWRRYLPTIRISKGASSDRSRFCSRNACVPLDAALEGRIAGMIQTFQYGGKQEAEDRIVELASERGSFWFGNPSSYSVPPC
jgi:hypothetical protein